jgi:hypothetical protein
MNIIRRIEPAQPLQIAESRPAPTEEQTLPNGVALNEPIQCWQPLNEIERAIAPTLMALETYRAEVRNRQGATDSLRYRIWLCHKRLERSQSMAAVFEKRIADRQARFSRITSAPDSMARLASEIQGFGLSLSGLDDAAEDLRATIEAAEAELAALAADPVEVPQILRNLIG